MLAIKKRKTIWFHKHDISQYKRLFDDAQDNRIKDKDQGLIKVEVLVNEAHHAEDENLEIKEREKH
uniref:Uncharacterized protein n=1 Tax=Meloidogyne enterolobii TaxID=390850 RepID=A0A6V7X3I8_MELEN|nr:unnamed protein product [Meloidogyne enterolobii]